MTRTTYPNPDPYAIPGAWGSELERVTAAMDMEKDYSRNLQICLCCRCWVLHGAEFDDALLCGVCFSAAVKETVNNPALPGDLVAELEGSIAMMEASLATAIAARARLVEAAG